MQTEVQLSVDLEEWSYQVHISSDTVTTQVTRPIPDLASSRLYAHGWRTLLVDIGQDKVIIPKELFQMLEREIRRCQASL
ncbi:MAG: hypothetical protein MUP21_05245 [Dehalococcoidia bacterium]|nr:hypothetical protein [Dehalococcoidia bacterium]